MTHTTEQLQTMSDFEVNKALCTLLGKDVSGVDEQRNMMTGAVTEYCDKYSAIMPLAFERGMSINVASQFDYPLGDGYWVASESVSPAQGMTIDVGGKSFTSDNPLRAIACLLLLIGGE